MFDRFKTAVNMRRHASKKSRQLEIGPGDQRIDGFETLNIVSGKNVDYVQDATKLLPFPDETFDLIYASHILEHVPWYQTDQVLKDWVRSLKKKGVLEIWVPDALKICKALVDFEVHGQNYIAEDGWYRFNDEKDPCKWAAGRMYTYGDGTGRVDHPNWHHALFTPRYLTLVMQKAGLVNIEPMSRSQVRGMDHGWINLGMRGQKP